jgi:dTDP-glucose pyrophosphorylase
MINVIVLMSGGSQAFAEAGHIYPKNLVEIGGAPLLRRVLDRLAPLKELGARILCLVRYEENRRHHTGAVVHLLDPEAVVVDVRGENAGAACSALLAVSHIDNEHPLVIVNGDQILDADLPAILKDFQSRGLDGGIIVFEDVHPRWSFVKTDTSGRVIETAEKRPISKLATAGFYYFARGSDFVLAASEMIKKDAQVDGHFFICPSYNELILRQGNVGIYVVPRSAYHSLATPGDVSAYEEYLRETAR